jgi:hypothetical protein
MIFKLRAALVSAICCALVAPLTGRAADEPVPNVAFLSLAGDSITTQFFVRSTGSKMDGNRKMVMPIDNPVFDVEAIQYANKAFKQLRPGVKTTLMVTADKGLFQAQNDLFESVEANKDNRTYLSSLLSNRAVTQLILITKNRAYAEFKVQNGLVGSGRLEGLGFYMDNETRLMNSRSLVTGDGFVATYVYLKMRLIDARTLAVLKEVDIKESDLNVNYPLTEVHQVAWDATTSEQKVKRLNEVIAGAMGDAIPALLRP